MGLQEENTPRQTFPPIGALTEPVIYSDLVPGRTNIFRLTPVDGSISSPSSVGVGATIRTEPSVSVAARTQENERLITEGQRRIAEQQESFRRLCAEGVLTAPEICIRVSGPPARKSTFEIGLILPIVAGLLILGLTRR